MWDVRSFLVESGGLTKSDVDNAEYGNEDLQQVFLWALGLEQAPRSNRYGNYGLPFAIHYVPIIYLLQVITYYRCARAPDDRSPDVCLPFAPPPPAAYV